MARVCASLGSTRFLVAGDFHLSHLIQTEVAANEQGVNFGAVAALRDTFAGTLRQAGLSWAISVIGRRGKA